MLDLSIQRNKFVVTLTAICGFYFLLELAFNSYAMIIADEFWFAHAAYQYKSLLPYRDFSPYKTVLGYYFLLFIFSLVKTKTLLSTYVLAKNCIALINVFVLFGIGLALRKFCSYKAILLTLALFILSENVILYSTNIRVDLFAYWFCLFGLYFLLEKRFILAGILLGLSFITSQKTIWYLAAINLTFILQWIITQRHRSTFRAMLSFNAGCASIILVYIAFWATFSSLQIVIDSIFFEAKAMYQLDWYAVARKPFWAIVLLNNPFLFLSWPILFITLCGEIDGDNFKPQRFFLFSIITAIFLFLIPYKQVFPYYMQVAFPIFIFVYAAFFTWLWQLFDTNNAVYISHFAKKLAWAFSFVYLFGLCAIILWLKLLKVYLILAFIPFIISLYFTYPNLRLNKLPQHFIVMIIAFIGFIYPMILFIPSLPNLNASYQKANMKLLSSLVADNSDYVAGTDFIYNKNQPIRGMQHLNGPGVNYLFEPFAPKLRAAMVASLSFDPTVTVDSIINALQKSNVKVYVNNYRMNEIPQRLKDFLATQYMHYWGSLYLYAPHIIAGENAFKIKFSGKYLVITPSDNKITLDNHEVSSNSVIELHKGYHLSQSSSDYRLKLIPDINMNHSKQDEWAKMI